MAISPMLKKAYWSLTIAGGLYFVLLSLLLNEKVQRNALYLHKVRAWWQDLDHPEPWGFLKNQVQPFHISTPDNELLYAWHIVPVAIYAAHEERFVKQHGGLVEDVTRTLAFRLLKEDPESRVVISFHGNAGTVGQGWRTDTYRALASGAADKIHVLTVDYRGFGYSTGIPTEEGLIIDGISLVKWALNVAKIPPERVAIVGQSLGTAVATAVAEFFATELKIEFAGLVLVAPFSDIPTLMLTYSIGNVIPILSPLQPYPKVQQYFSQSIRDTWKTFIRIENLVRCSHNTNLVLIHARNDMNIPLTHSNTLFYAAVNATSEKGMTIKQIDGVKNHVDHGKGGWTNTWTAGNGPSKVKRIHQIILMDGGHNRVTTYAPVAKAVYDILCADASGYTQKLFTQ